MQNRYVGDIGDFAKYSLLNALAGSDLGLGVLWYLNSSEEANTDGRFTEYPELRECDPNVYLALESLLRTNRNLESIERSGILPRGTRFFSDPLPVGTRRDRWNDDAINAVAGADIVFFDPDTGLTSDSGTAYRRAPRKYTSVQELLPYMERDQSLILYQHQSRRGTFADQLEKLCMAIRGIGARDVWVLTFHRLSARAFLVVPAQRHADLLRERSRRFIRSSWGRQGHFKLMFHRLPESHDPILKTRPTMSTTSISRKSKQTTNPGYVNRNHQVVIRATGLPGTDHGQRVYVLQCGSCAREYGANGSDIFQRRCPWCQSGKPGLAIR